MSKFLNSSCLTPLYLTDDEGTAMHCGLLNGIVYSLFFTPIVLFIFYKMYLKPEMYSYNFVKYGLIITLLIIWIGFPLFIRFAYKQMWNGYNQTLDKLIKNEGLSRVQAIAILVQLFGDTSLSRVLSLPDVSSVVFTQKGQPIVQKAKPITKN